MTRPFYRTACTSELFGNHSVPIRSLVSIPLVAKEHRLGTALLTYASPRQLYQQEITHADEASDQMALALWNVQQDAELKRSLREAKAISDIALRSAKPNTSGWTRFCS